MGCIKTIIQLSLIGLIGFFFTMCTDNLNLEPSVIGNPDYCVSYSLLATQASDTTSLKIWYLYEEDDFDLAAGASRFTNIKSIDLNGHTFSESPVFSTLNIKKTEATVELSSEISNHTSITQLTLSDEGIRTLPASIDVLVNLDNRNL